ncbi:MAG: peptidoglycan editing factor PgeF [Ktedonobacterales bacterium]|nr:peptidoglycan editing factor PgeF [Ktedonobacterales bacterium]
MQQHSNGDILWFQFEQFAGLADRITHGVFARSGGVSAAPYAALNCGLSVGDDREHVAQNRDRVIATLPGHPPLMTVHPVHGSTVVEIHAEDLADPEAMAQKRAVKADAMITQARDVGLFWAYADCTPILMVDPVHSAIALVHAGWRGASQAVGVAALHALGTRYGTRPQDVRVGLGPSIGPCCYEVDEPVRAAFAAHPLANQHSFFSTIMVPDGHGDERPSLRLDVPACSRAQLIAAGVPAEQIEVSGFCTGHQRDLFFSHRMENGKTGRFAVVLALR